MRHLEPVAAPPLTADANADLVRKFTAAWARPAVDDFLALLTPDARLLQPVTPVVVGHAAARREFGRLLKWLPDIHGVVDEWSASGETILIAWRLRFTLGTRPFELRIVDRLVRRDGLIAEREAYFDSVRFLAATLSRPSAWMGYLRYRGYLPGGDG